MSANLVLHNGGRGIIGDAEVLRFERVNEQHQYMIVPHLFDSAEQADEHQAAHRFTKWIDAADIKDKWKHKAVVNHRGE